MSEIGNSRFLVIGKNGRISTELMSQLGQSLDPSSLKNFSSRGLLTGKENEKLYAENFDANLHKNTFIWASGSSGARSSNAECEIDELALRKTMEHIVDQDMNRPLFCYLSSGGTVYGKSPGHVNELSPLNPQSAYAEMKVRSEEFLRDIASENKIDLIVLRLANIYGSRMTNAKQGLVDLALSGNLQKLSANLNSTKQYGTFRDYASSIIQIINLKITENWDDKINTLNVYPPHEYSIGKILHLTEGLGPLDLQTLIQNQTERLEEETVILERVSKIPMLRENWVTLERYIEDVQLSDGRR